MKKLHAAINELTKEHQKQLEQLDQSPYYRKNLGIVGWLLGEPRSQLDSIRAQLQLDFERRLIDLVMSYHPLYRSDRMNANYGSRS